MRRLFVLPILLMTGCFQTENSSSQDALAEGTPEFLAARTVFSQSCFNCHNYHTQTEEQLIAAGLVVPGDPDNSPIFNRLQGSTGPGNKNMPQGGSIAVADVQIIEAWIEGI